MAEESGSRTRQETPNAPSPVLKTGAATGRHSPPPMKMAQCTGRIKLSLTARKIVFHGLVLLHSVNFAGVATFPGQKYF